MSVQVRRYPLPLAPASLAALVPCSSGAGCPLGVDVPALAAAVRAGDADRAYRIVRASNPFASSCGHGCHAPCESSCRRRHRGAPVAISALEMFASGTAQPALTEGDGACTSAHDARSVAGLAGRTMVQPARSGTSDKRVAVVGGGAAGMACAHDLALLGHECVVFDSEQEPGGLLTRGIPDFRFPAASARAECASILALGVQFRGATLVHGADALRALLDDGFDAVFLAIGASAPSSSLFEDAGAHVGLTDAMAFLRSTTAIAGRVAVIGDGDLAIDAARTAFRRGRQEHGNDGVIVQLILTAPIDRSAISPAMLGAAIADGVVLHDGWSPQDLCVEEGQVTGLEVAREDGRVSSIIQCEHVITAATRAPALAALDAQLPLDGDGHVAVDPETLRTVIPGIWAGGACAFGHRSIAHAVADGKRAAWHIHAALMGVPVRSALISAWVEGDDRHPDHTRLALSTSRRSLPLRTAAPADPFSASAAPSPEAMQQEAARCYDCAVTPAVDDGCTLCGTCVAECPESAFALAGEPRQLVLDQDRCTRCGICAERCPEGAITMVRAIWEERLTTSLLPPEPSAPDEDESVDEEPALTTR